MSKYTMYNYVHRRPLSAKDPCMADDQKHSRLKRPEFIPFLIHIYFAHFIDLSGHIIIVLFACGHGDYKYYNYVCSWLIYIEKWLPYII